MTYIDTSDTGQGAKLNNQDIFGCLFYCYMFFYFYKNYDFLLIIKKNI